MPTIFYFSLIQSLYSWEKASGRENVPRNFTWGFLIIMKRKMDEKNV